MDNIDNLRVFEDEELDFKENRDIKFRVQQNDDIILKFRLFNYGTPVDTSTMHLEFRASKPDGELYSEENNIELSSNEIVITCDRQLTTASGEVDCQLRVWNPLNYRQVSSNRIRIMVQQSVAEGEDYTPSTSLISALDHLDSSICRAVDLETEFDEAIAEAEEVENQLETKITEADGKLDTLNDKITEASTTINDLINERQTCQNTLTEMEAQVVIVENTIAEGQAKIEEIQDIVDTANSAGDVLQSKIDTSNTAYTNLQNKIDEALDVMDDFRDLDTEALVEKTNKLYNEFYPLNDVSGINHNLGYYPIVLATYTNYGFGMGNCEDQGFGGETAKTIQVKTEYLDENNLKVIIPDKYKLTNPTVQKVRNDYFIITGTGTQSIELFLR